MFSLVVDDAEPLNNHDGLLICEYVIDLKYRLIFCCDNIKEIYCIKVSFTIVIISWDASNIFIYHNLLDATSFDNHKDIPVKCQTNNIWLQVLNGNFKTI